ncbi:MAG: serine/threonine-protein kinase [Myxococcota bacterium]
MERFGRFVLLEHVAQGGMAEVFRAASFGSAGFAKPLAIKRILPHLAADPQFVRMLVDEAHIASALNHPNIVQVLDLGQENGSFFIAMEFVAGRSLNKVFEAAVARGCSLPLPFVFHVAQHVLAALAHAHGTPDSSGPRLIHRDVSPHNILVSFDGGVKLGDFGIAKLQTHSEHTTGPIKGKPGYMSPEQVTGTSVDHRVDLYALGVVLHELVAMKRLRTGDNPLRTLMDVAKGEYPRFTELGVAIPDDAAEVIYRALAVSPDERWPDARTFGAAVEDVIRRHGWQWSASNVTALMAELCAEEIEQERRTQEHFAGVIRALSTARTQDISGILARHGEKQPERTLVAAKPVVKGAAASSRWRWVAASALVGGAVAVTAFLLPSSVIPPATAVAPRPGTLVVETDPPGARVSLAGKPLARPAPAVVDQLTPGSLEVEARMDGREPARQRVEVRPGEVTTVRLSLAESVVELPVTSEPPGAVILVGGREVGSTPGKVRVVGAAPIDVEMRLPGHQAFTQRVEARSLPASLHAVLTRAPVVPRPEKRAKPRESAPPPAATPAPVVAPPVAAAPATGRLTLQSRPWARIILDGKDTGQFTPTANMEVPAGDHVVELVNDESGLRQSFKVNVPPGGSARVARDLR